MLLLVALLVGSVSAWGDNVTVLSENFNDGSATGWTLTGNTSFQGSNGAKSLQIASGKGAGTATTPAFATLVGNTATLTFTHISSGNATRTLTVTGVNCKVNGNTSITVSVPSSSSSTETATISITDASTSSSITFSAANGQGTLIDDVVVYYTSKSDLTSFAFANTTPSVTLVENNGSYEAEYSQAVSFSPNTYTGTITYSIDEDASSIGENTLADVGKDGVVTILASANEASTIVVKASGAATESFNAPDDVSYTLTVNKASEELGEITFSPASGAYYYGESITINASNKEHIYYTTDGTTPTTSSPEYTAPLTLTSSMTLKALAVKGVTEKTGSIDYTLKAPEAPTFDVAAGAVAENTPLTITIGEGGSTVVYTIDGSDPTAESAVYSDPIAIDNALTIKACTMDAGNNLSSVTSATYTLTLPTGTKKYVLMTDTDQLTDGGKIIIVNDGEDYVLSTNQKTNNREAISITTSEDHDILETNLPANAQVIELEETIYDTDKTGWYFKVGDNAYLYASSSSSNQLRTNSKETVGNNGRASVSISNGATSIVFTGSYTCKIMRYNSNNGSPLFACYDGATSQTAVKVYVLESEPATIQANVSAAGWATYATKYPMTFEDGDAYIIVSADDNEKTTTIQKVTSVPANTAVLLKGTSGEATQKTATIISGDAPDAPATNYLHIVGAGETINEASNVYVLANKTEGVGFYPWTGTALARGKVYMRLPAGAKLNDFYAFGEEAESETSGISSVSTRSTKQGEFYNLAGQRVSNPTKGIYIVNGKKVIVK